MEYKNLKIAVLAPSYPSYKKPNMMAFIHSRVRAYQRLGIQIDVYTISNNKSKYIFETVNVYNDNLNNIKQILTNKIYDSIFIHFLNKEIMDVINDKNKCYVWVHGFEALSWKRRLFNLNLHFPLYIYQNNKQLKCFRNYINHHSDTKFIFVSDWMYRITCHDIKSSIDNYCIIPNYIDNSIFNYNNKDISQRKKILIVRSFENRKYANDISIKFIKELSKKSYFNELTITIYGVGKYFDKLTQKVTKFNNVNVCNKFMTQEEVAKIHKEYGVFLCPTRQDAQGVSMCEAMSSGLVPITSYNTAIPEFITNKKDGLLCKNNDISTFVDAYELILNDSDFFMKLSESASKRIQYQCSFNNTILKEIKLIPSNF
ncbi:glycosyltransferase family 4 protein [Candidatus Stoquefichus massiliensis]|uniref:glycosyltransferase family 4 protein n=1 Tax=Candidatus Stoquefichus massiliensis TaxID=1470350 RepID=UPI0004B697E7|nr:glycosyltransferase family 4 protein [Candidatus Stoquefichus massiliensis]